MCTLSFHSMLIAVNYLFSPEYIWSQRAVRPTGGINKLLHFLPISLHKLVDQFFGQVFSDTRFAAVVQVNKLAQYSARKSQSFGLSSILEADTQKIVTMVCGTFEK